MKKLLIVIQFVLMMAISSVMAAILPMAALPASVASTGRGPTGSQGNTMGGGEHGSSTISQGNGGSGPPKGP